MKKFLVLICLVSGGLLTANLTAFASITQFVDQHPVGGSGIQGHIMVIDTGTSQIIHGTATGLNPAHPYFSLIYTLGSHPGGISESMTLPSTSNAIPPCGGLNQQGASTINTNQMVVGFWQVNPDGTGTLDDVKSATGNSQDPLFMSIPGVAAALESFGYVFGANSYAPTGTWATMSIRDAAQNFALQACGLAHP
jgi:hypothetical protein